MKISKINLIPVKPEEEYKWLFDQVMQQVKPVIPWLNKYGDKYEHEVPWEEKFFEAPKYFLFRVKIGAVGRINTVEDAIRLGLESTISATQIHFTSYALFFIFRIARARRKEHVFIKKLNGWIDNAINNKHPNSRFLELYNAYT
jgi:hypothetical protein